MKCGWPPVTGGPPGPVTGPITQRHRQMLLAFSTSPSDVLSLFKLGLSVTWPGSNHSLVQRINNYRKMMNHEKLLPFEILRPLSALVFYLQVR